MWRPDAGCGTRLEASEAKATKPPSLLIAAVPRLVLSPWVPSAATLTRVVWPVTRSWTKMSVLPLVSPGTRLVADDEKETKRPSPLRSGPLLLPFASLPLLVTLTRWVLPLARSRTNTSTAPLLSPPTRLVAAESNATTSPLLFTAGALERALMPSPCLPLLRTLTSSVRPARRSRRRRSPPPP
jgi:hypothetical protein